MKTFIALLRGINVGGHKKIKMADLRALLTGDGLECVQTYIQSGNIIFQAKSETNDLADRIMSLIKNSFGFEVPVMIYTTEQLENIIKNCPFEGEKRANSYFTLLQNSPTRAKRSELMGVSFPDEEFHLVDSCIYSFCAHGYRNAKLNNNYFEKKLEMAATTRNLKTMRKLLEMSQIP
ncbi:DUF1697 domain-containing protein [Sungkyunkwania multivorans]|uniref:DUF1697 domain-containing protein n=1 Tax=Sungkyunkwania multivorans TaxID=1173618 RepID=A0ABW3D2K8_9FLAO